MTVDTPTLLDRLLRYVRIDTEAKDGSATYPSSAGQLEFGKILLGELKALGLTDARQRDFGVAPAPSPATVTKSVPVIAWLAHLDTSPETTGKGVNPIVHRNYDGKDIVLPGDRSKVLRPSEIPELK